MDPVTHTRVHSVRGRWGVADEAWLWATVCCVQWQHQWEGLAVFLLVMVSSWHHKRQMQILLVLIWQNMFLARHHTAHVYIMPVTDMWVDAPTFDCYLWCSVTGWKNLCRVFLLQSRAQALLKSIALSLFACMFPRLNTETFQLVTLMQLHEVTKLIEKGRGAILKFFFKFDRPWNKNSKSCSSDFWNASRTPCNVFKLIESSAYVYALCL